MDRHQRRRSSDFVRRFKAFGYAGRRGAGGLLCGGQSGRFGVGHHLRPGIVPLASGTRLPPDAPSEQSSRELHFTHVLWTGRDAPGSAFSLTGCSCLGRRKGPPLLDEGTQQ